jgi:hypothetical protein
VNNRSALVAELQQQITDDTDISSIERHLVVPFRPSYHFQLART